MENPKLSKEQLDFGFHIWTEFKYGNPEQIGFEHWKKCPCGRDMRLK